MCIDLGKAREDTNVAEIGKTSGEYISLRPAWQFSKHSPINSPIRDKS